MQPAKLPISVLIAAKNEILNIQTCVASISRWADEIVLIDSGSTDGTAELAASLGCKVFDFTYSGGWPKKRQWALETVSFRNDWIFVLDADEVVSDAVWRLIAAAISSTKNNGYWLRFHTAFLGRDLRYGNSSFYKLALFRHGTARYEQRLTEQDTSMADMEIHEHVVLDGVAGRIETPIWDRNRNSLFRFLAKHNEYSNWESRAFLEGDTDDIPQKFWGTQAQRRRWLKRKFLMVPGSPFAYFLMGYVLKRGFLDGREGLIYARIQANEMFNVKAKIFERQQDTAQK